MDDYFFAGRCNCFFEMIFRLQIKAGKVDKVGYHPDIVLYLKKLVCIISQMLRNSCYAIRFVDRKGYHRLKGAVAAHQGDVGSVQGGYNRNINAVSQQYLLGHKSCRGMRYGIMNM